MYQSTDPVECIGTSLILNFKYMGLQDISYSFNIALHSFYILHCWGPCTLVLFPPHCCMTLLPAVILTKGVYTTAPQTHMQC